MKQEIWTVENIAHFRCMLHSPMPEHNINTRYIFKDGDEETKEDNNTEDKK